MPTIYGGREDKQIWRTDNKDVYTVKLAYQYAMETLIDNEEYRISRNASLLWNLQIP